MEYYSAIKRNESGSSVMMWMNPDSVIQNEVSQKEKNKYHILMYISYINVCIYIYIYIYIYGI